MNTTINATSFNPSKAELKARAIENLRDLLSPGDTVYSVIRSVAKSGMSRRIDFYVIRDNQPRYLTGWISHVMGKPNPTDGMRVDGCGMDMCFHVVYSLGRILWQDESTRDTGYSLKSERI